MMTCPHCGGAVAALDLRFDFTSGMVRAGRFECKLGPVQMTLLEHLMDAYPHGVEIATLVAQMYPDENHEAAAHNRLRANITVVRSKFAAAQMPWEICLVSRGADTDSQIALVPAHALDLARTA